MTVKIRQIREQKQIKQIELAKRVGLSQAEVSRKESGVTSLDVKQLRVFADALGVPVTELLDDNDQLKEVG